MARMSGRLKVLKSRTVADLGALHVGCGQHKCATNNPSESLASMSKVSLDTRYATYMLHTILRALTSRHASRCCPRACADNRSQITSSYRQIVSGSCAASSVSDVLCT